MSRKPPVALRIGVIDDDPAVRRALCRLMRSHGYHGLPYESAEAALADPAFLDLDCLVLDIELPGMTGVQLRDRLNKLGSRVPYIFLTAHSPAEFSDWEEMIGTSPVLFKPVGTHQLLSSIEALFLKL